MCTFLGEKREVQEIFSVPPLLQFSFQSDTQNFPLKDHMIYTIYWMLYSQIKDNAIYSVLCGKHFSSFGDTEYGKGTLFNFSLNLFLCMNQ